MNTKFLTKMDIETSKHNDMNKKYNIKNFQIMQTTEVINLKNACKENKPDNTYFAATLGRKNYGRLELKSGSHEIFFEPKTIFLFIFIRFNIVFI